MLKPTDASSVCRLFSEHQVPWLVLISRWPTQVVFAIAAAARTDLIGPKAGDHAWPRSETMVASRIVQAVAVSPRFRITPGSTGRRLIRWSGIEGSANTDLAQSRTSAE